MSIQAATEASRRGVRRPLSGFVVYFGLIAVVLVFSITLRDSGFLTPENISNILRQTAMVSVMAFGMTFALSAGEIDLSISQVVGLASLVAGVLLRDTTILLAVPAALSVGLIVGLLNGVLTTRLRIPSFLVTLGTAGIVGGLARIITDLQAVPVTDEVFTTVFGSGEVGPFSSLFLWTMIALVISHLVYRKTTFGRRVLATGGNRTAARFSGIDTNRVRVAVLVICSFTAAMAGIMYAARLHGARYTLGEADLLTVIAASVIGGTSMAGGRGSIVGALVGSLLMGVLNNGLILMRLSVSEQMIVRGAIIVIAVAISLRESRED
jgi:ribose transport system permease protein